MTRSPRRADEVRFLCRGSGELQGAKVTQQQRTLADLAGVFADQVAWAAMDGKQLVYRVQLYLPVPDNAEGGLFFGNTTIMPGRVGDEYFMTKGHFHACRNRAEYYWTLQGRGGLILMDEQRHCRLEWLSPGSLHYIPGHTAHRVANTGDEPLTFAACWPADAGHDYDTIARHGFTARLRCVDGEPTLVPEQKA
ncbi:MAG: cupin domain-containing protein [Phycisphaeraceae bacterium]|nr:cupin domain-containing protein [Phycisphaeraceae bacterium]